MSSNTRSLGTLFLALGMFVLVEGLAQAQGYAPGVNPSNPQDLTNRSNPQSLTVPGASNPQDLVRSPPAPQVVSPANPTNLGSRLPPASSSLGYTHVDPPIEKPSQKFVRRKHHVKNPQNE